MSKILDWFKNRAEGYLRANKWIKPLLGFFVGAAALFMVGYGVWSLFRKSDKVAQLKHKLDVVEAEKKRAEFKKRSNRRREAIRQYDKVIAEMNDRISELKEELTTKRQAYALREKQIDAIRNWRGLSNYVESRSGG